MVHAEPTLLADGTAPEPDEDALMELGYTIQEGVDYIPGPTKLTMVDVCLARNLCLYRLDVHYTSAHCWHVSLLRCQFCRIVAQRSQLHTENTVEIQSSLSDTANGTPALC